MMLFLRLVFSNPLRLHAIQQSHIAVEQCPLPTNHDNPTFYFLHQDGQEINIVFLNYNAHN